MWPQPHFFLWANPVANHLSLVGKCLGDSLEGNIDKNMRAQLFGGSLEGKSWEQNHVGVTFFCFFFFFFFLLMLGLS